MIQYVEIHRPAWHNGWGKYICWCTAKVNGKDVTVQQNFDHKDIDSFDPWPMLRKLESGRKK